MKIKIFKNLATIGSSIALLFSSLFLAAPVSANSSWTQEIYNPSGRALAPEPAKVSDGTVSFTFTPDVYTATLTTNDKSLTGNLTGYTLNETVSVTGMNPSATFSEQNGGGCTPDNQYVRFYFTSPSGAGTPGTTGLGTAGFYTQFWWSNPVHVNLVNNGSGGVAPTPISVNISDPNSWSDWNGHEANFNSDVTEAFNRATANVQTIGLSFGGGCFFENGVTISTGTATFNSVFTETP